MVYISGEAVIEAIRYRVCQGQGNKDHVCKRGSCAYCGIMEIMSDISSIPPANVKPVVYAHKTINVGLRSYCSNCGKLAHMEDFCSKCGAKVEKDDING